MPDSHSSGPPEPTSVVGSGRFIKLTHPTITNQTLATVLGLHLFQEDGDQLYLADAVFMYHSRAIAAIRLSSEVLVLSPVLQRHADVIQTLRLGAPMAPEVPEVVG